MDLHRSKFAEYLLRFTWVLPMWREGRERVLHKHLINLSMSFMRSRKICCERNSIREESKRRVNKQSKVIITTLNSCESWRCWFLRLKVFIKFNTPPILLYDTDCSGWREPIYIINRRLNSWQRAQVSCLINWIRSLTHYTCAAY